MNYKHTFTYNKIYQAYLDCRENKRSTINALKFEWDLEKNLFELEKELQNKTYHPGRSICFVVTDPSLREIFAASFKDRIVHHVLVNELELAGERIFIHDSYSCRKSKGTHLAIKRLKSFFKKSTNNYTKQAFYLQLDISGFFMAIDHRILYSLARKLVLKQNKPYRWKKDILWLAKVIIFHKPTENYIIKGNPALFKLIPSRKSLFGAGSYKGLPIGNYSSQFFANLYLNQLDHFIKRTLRQKYYLRYVDDLIILGKEREALQDLVNRIDIFLQQKLNLGLNVRKTKLQNINQGINFLGYVTKPHYVLARKRVVNTLKKKLYEFDQGSKEINPEQSLAIVNSYFGHFKHANSFNLKKNICKNHLGKLKQHIKPQKDYSFLQLKC